MTKTNLLTKRPEVPWMQWASSHILLRCHLMATRRYKKRFLWISAAPFNTITNPLKALEPWSSILDISMVAFLFQQQATTSMPKWSVLFIPVHNVGVPQGDVLSPFLFSLHTDSLTPRHSRLLKYADDFVLCNSYSKFSVQVELDEDLHRLITWSADHGLLINKTKCAECLFYYKNTSPQLPLSLINDEALSREQTVKYLCVHFNSNLTWSTNIDSVLTKCLKISFFYPSKNPSSSFYSSSSSKPTMIKTV